MIMLQFIKSYLNSKLKKWSGYNELVVQLCKLRDDQDRLMRSLNVGIDVHYKTDSWYVICIDGNPSIVKFGALPKEDIREINRFLKQFERSNRVIDDPMRMIWFKE
jgi:hypothetical protein